MSAPTLDPAPEETGTGRIPPHNTAAERALLGAWLLSPQARTHHVNPDDFYHPRLADIAQAITDLAAAGQPVDQVTVADQLERTGNLDRIGGPATITGLIADTPTTANAARYAQIVRRDGWTRRLMTAAHQLIDAGYALDDQALEAAEWALLEAIAEDIGAAT